MGAHELIRRSLHDLLIQVFRIKPGAIHIERVLDTGIINGIGIFLADAGADGIEVLPNLKGLRHHDIHRQVGIQGIREAADRDHRLRTEIGDVAAGVDTGVGAPAAGHMDTLARDHGHRFFQRLLNCGKIFLNLPAMIGCSLIFQNQCDITHTYLTDRNRTG